MLWFSPTNFVQNIFHKNKCYLASSAQDVGRDMCMSSQSVKCCHPVLSKPCTYGDVYACNFVVKYPPPNKKYQWTGKKLKAKDSKCECPTQHINTLSVPHNNVSLCEWIHVKFLQCYIIHTVPISSCIKASILCLSAEGTGQSILHRSQVVFKCHTSHLSYAAFITCQAFVPQRPSSSVLAKWKYGISGFTTTPFYEQCMFKCS